MGRIHLTRTRNAIGDGMVQRILDTLERATEAEWTEGTAWYGVANEVASEIGPSTVQGAGIIAALSPQIGWVANVTAAVAVVAGEDPTPYGVLGPNIVKAARIRDGEPPSVILGGRKVRSFWRNIAAPYEPGAVTVDRHALNIALVGAGKTGADHRLLARKGGYQLVAGAYRTASRDAWLLPQQLQAITWLTHRRLLDEAAYGNLAAAHIRQRANLVRHEEEF